MAFSIVTEADVEARLVEAGFTDVLDMVQANQGWTAQATRFDGAIMQLNVNIYGRISTGDDIDDVAGA